MLLESTFSCPLGFRRSERREMAQISYFLLFSIVFVFTSRCDSARILGLFTSPSKSHLLIHTAIIDALVEKGHEATVVSTVPVPRTIKNYRHILIDVPGFSADFFTKLVNNPQPIYKRFPTLTQKMNECANASLNHPAMKELMEKETFDLVILGYFLNEFQLGVAAHFKCPAIVSFMIRPISTINNFVGNPKEVAYVPNLFGGGKQPMGFWARVKNFLFVALFEDTLIPLISYRKQETFYNYNFPPEKYPSLDEVKKNISLVLTNHHFSQGPIRPNVPAMVEIGGIQIKDKPDPLPEDLKSIIDNAKHGVVYLSFGSNIEGGVLDKTKVKIMFEVLSKLPQIVVWKWGGSEVPGQSPNIIYRSWLPQDDILAHPNVRLFVTHGGQGSVVESQYHGVPMVGVPLFGEQHANMANVQSSGYGLTVDFITMTVESFGGTIHEVLSNSRYRNNVKQFARLYKDRPMSAKETAVFWVEYVLRHHGAPHMQSPAVHLNTFQLMSLDVLAFIFVVIYLVYKIIRVICSLLWSRRSKGKNKKE